MTKRFERTVRKRRKLDKTRQDKTKEPEKGGIRVLVTPKTPRDNSASRNLLQNNHASRLSVQLLKSFKIIMNSKLQSAILKMEAGKLESEILSV